MALYYDTSSTGTTVAGGTTMNPNLLLPFLLLLGGRGRHDRHLAREIVNIFINQLSISLTTTQVQDLVAALEDLFRARESGQAVRLELLLPILLLGSQTSAQAAVPAPTTPPAPAPAAASLDPTTLAVVMMLALGGPAGF